MSKPLELPEGALTIHLPFEVASVGVARARLTRELIARHASARAIQDGNTIVGELVMNGVWHGRPTTDDDIQVSWWIAGGMVGLSVLDGGHVDRLTATMPDPGAEGGRGLAMVAVIADWWAYDTRDGTRVSAQLHLT